MRFPALAIPASILVVLGMASCNSQRTLPSTSATSSAPAYADSKQCAACHAAAAAGYRQSAMAHAFYRPAPDNTPEGKFFHPASKTWFEMRQRDGKFYQRRWQIGYQEKEENAEELSVDYVMGSGHQVRTYLHRTARGTLIELPLARYAEKGGSWNMNPGYDIVAPDTRRRIGYDCMFCHNAYPQIPAGHDAPGAEPVFDANLPQGIDCQRCHGPGAEHVKLAQTAGTQKEAIRKAILNPKRDMEVCMQCHLETTSARLPNSIRRFERGPFSYRPGTESLGDFMVYFDHAKGTGRDDKFEIVNSVYRLRQSRCFRASGGKLTCQTCHNPHQTLRGDAAVQHYTKVCRDCHATVQLAGHPRDPNCLACHMPKRRTDDVVHAVMTDHLIQRRKPSRDLLAEFPERHETDATAYHGEVVPYYSSQTPHRTDEDLYFAVAQVSEKSNLAAGLPRLAAEIAKQTPSRPEFYLALGDAWRDSKDPAKAIGPYEEALKRAPASPIPWKRLAIALKDSGQYARLTETLQKALKAAPDDPSLWFELGSFDSDQGRYAQAITELEKASALDPDLAEARLNLGVALAESGQTDRAEAAFRDALRIRPYDARAYANLGKLLATKNDASQALYCYAKAVAYRPDYATAHFDFGVLLARENRIQEAQKEIQAAIQYDPQMAEAHDLLGGILELGGKIQAAEREYREALRIRPDLARAHLNLGALLAGKGDRAAATEQLQIAIKSADPQVGAQAKQALEELSRGR